MQNRLKTHHLSLIILLAIFCLSSYKRSHISTKDTAELILGNWKLDSFHLYTAKDLETTSKTKSIGYWMSLTKHDFKEVYIYGLKLKLNKRIQFTKEQIIYGSKIRFNRKPYRTSTDFKIEDKVLTLFHKQGESGRSVYHIKTLTLNALVFEGDIHMGGCYGYIGTLFCSRK